MPSPPNFPPYTGNSGNKTSKNVKPGSDTTLEMEVLAQCLCYPSVAPVYASKGVTPEMFSRPVHQQIWTVIQETLEAGLETTFFAVGQRIRQRGWWAEIGVTFASLDAKVIGITRPSAQTAEWAAGKLAELARMRSAYYDILAIREEFESKAAAPAPEELQVWLKDVAMKLAIPTGGMSSGEQLVEDFRDALREEEAQRVRVWPFFSIDAVIDGVRPGEVCGLLARPGVGKTMVMCNMITAIGQEFKEKKKVGSITFSLEMPKAQLVERIMRIATTKDKTGVRYAMRTGGIDMAAWQEQFAATVIVDTPGLSIAEMNGLIEVARRGPLAECTAIAVLIDHLGLIGGDRRMSTYDRTSMHAREMKELAKRHKASVIVATQVGRMGNQDGSEPLTLGSARDSGVVEEAADYLIGIRRIDNSKKYSAADRGKFDQTLFVEVIKNRHDRLGREYAYRLGSDLLLKELGSDVEAPQPIPQPTGRRS